MDSFIGLDFETYGGVDLPKHGLHRYVNDPTFRPLIACTMTLNNDGSEVVSWFDFSNQHIKPEISDLEELIADRYIAAHNAGFEQAVLSWMGLDYPSNRFIDTAMLARAAGAASKLETAAPQLLNTNKMAEGHDLIKLFSIPGKYQEARGDLMFDPQIFIDHPEELVQFYRYCQVDAELSLRIALNFLSAIPYRELQYDTITRDMNNTGWHVDVAAVLTMQDRFKQNVADAELDFRIDTDEWELNLNSHKQLVEWCANRLVVAKSFDEQHVTRLLTSLRKRLLNPNLPAKLRANYTDVVALLETKQEIGGSSLKKLQTILDTVGSDDRLHGQYLHIGAGATYRTTGMGVQMQNLPRLHGAGADMTTLWDPKVEWSNAELSANLRQLFTSSDPKGFLIVGDFSSVESRGLAWQAGENWKLDAYRRGEDLYRLQAGQFFHKPTDEVTKDQRQFGKVGELSCGYGAGGMAVREFASKMGVTMSEGEAVKLVRDWRQLNTNTEEYWRALDDALRLALKKSFMSSRVEMPHGFVKFTVNNGPVSMWVQDPRARTVTMSLYVITRLGTRRVFDRAIHGVHEVGGQIRYYKPSKLKSGDLWKDTFTDPKTGQTRQHTLYGGKLAGLLTQSLCREIFFECLAEVDAWCKTMPNVKLVGQFHDEIVLDWVPMPGQPSLDRTREKLEEEMTCTSLPNFPLAADIKHDYRYTK